MEASNEPRPGARSVVVVANLRSRRTSALFEKAIEQLRERGVTIAESHTVDDGNDVRERVRGAIADGHEFVLVAGGDGTMTSIVGEFAHTSAVLGVLPLGTGNSFAQTLGMAPTIESAVETIASGRIESVDLGIVNGRHFANFATIGLSSTIARSTPNLLKKFLGPLAYVVAAIVPLLRSSSFRAEVRSEVRTVSVRTHQLIVANGRYFGFTPILPDATIVDGELALFTTSGCSRWEVARMFAAFNGGRQTKLADAEYFSAAKIDIETVPKQYLDIDGEAFGQTPARFSVDRGALRVLVPSDFTGA